MILDSTCLDVTRPTCIAMRNYLFNNDEDEEENGDNDNVAVIPVNSRLSVEHP